MAGDMIFGDFQLPAMEPGEYCITATQEVTRRSEELGSFENAIEVSVQGVRFRLPPDRVHGRFPPPGALGDFDEVLPHIVLSAPTLPWQREPAASEGRTNEPWVALLVLDQAGPEQEVRTGTLGELFASDAYLGPRRLEMGEALENPCQYIDLENFDAIGPRFSELRWLTHVRTVDDQEYAVVVGNRLPAPGCVTRCCLVSLEGVFEENAEAPPKGVRLPVLDTWTFGATADSESFAATMCRLSTGTLRLQQQDPPLEHGSAALGHGYTLLPHEMRQGARSASWYRGPLVPTEASKTADLEPGGDSADELLRYDPETGMFDVSLAAAWQLGRLLALADAELSVQIAAWKAGAHRAQALAGERRLLADRLEVDAIKPAAELQKQLADALVKPFVDRLVE